MGSAVNCYGLSKDRLVHEIREYQGIPNPLNKHRLRPVPRYPEAQISHSETELESMEAVWRLYNMWLAYDKR